jgi:hypothetical protein
MGIDGDRYSASAAYLGYATGILLLSWLLALSMRRVPGVAQLFR